MFFAQIFTPGQAHCSYVIGGQNECLVVDPARDLERYHETAASFGLPITAIIETHLHADFVSGHLDLAQQTGARIFAPAAAGCAFPHVALQDGETFIFDTLTIQLLETPGHTPERSFFIVTDRERGGEPLLAFSGDTLLVGDVGRPDLFPDRKEELAEKLYHSLLRIEELADGVEIYPAHGMGSLCGRSLSPKLWTTMGTERRFNYALHLHPMEHFRHELLTGMPEVPDHYARCSEINRLGPVPLGELTPPRKLQPREFARYLAQGAAVVDTRDYLSFAAAHIPGSFSVSLKGSFATFAGWILPPDRPLLLVNDRDKELPQVLTGLRRVGLDNVAGYLTGGMGEWINSGLETDHVDLLGVSGLQSLMEGSDAPPVLDNRLKSEWDEGHIAGTIHVPAPDVRRRAAEWLQQEPLVTICNTGNRSIMAASLLKQRGFKKVFNVIGGTTAWKAAGYPLVTP